MDEYEDDLPPESRTAQFYQAGSDASHPELVRHGAHTAKYAMNRSRLMAEHPEAHRPRLKVVLGGPSHTRVSAIGRRTTVADTQEE